MQLERKERAAKKKGGGGGGGGGLKPETRTALRRSRIHDSENAAFRDVFATPSWPVQLVQPVITTIIYFVYVPYRSSPDELMFTTP
jgi:hypothetical protein